MQQPTTVSVGPYSLVINTSGATSAPARQHLARQALAADDEAARGARRLARRQLLAARSDRWAGVILTKPNGPDGTEHRRQRLDPFIRCEHDGFAGQQRDEEAGYRQVEGERRVHRSALPAPGARTRAGPRQIARDAPVRDGRALGPARGPRGVDHVRQVLRSHPAVRRVRRLPLRSRSASTSSAHHARRVRGQLLLEGGLRQQHGHRGVLEHERQALRRDSRGPAARRRRRP